MNIVSSSTLCEYLSSMTHITCSPLKWTPSFSILIHHTPKGFSAVTITAIRCQTSKKPSTDRTPSSSDLFPFLTDHYTTHDPRILVNSQHSKNNAMVVVNCNFECHNTVLVINSRELQPYRRWGEVNWDEGHVWTHLLTSQSSRLLMKINTLCLSSSLTDSEPRVSELGQVPCKTNFADSMNPISVSQLENKHGAKNHRIWPGLGFWKREKALVGCHRALTRGWAH